MTPTPAPTTSAPWTVTATDCALIAPDGKRFADVRKVGASYVYRVYRPDGSTRGGIARTFDEARIAAERKGARTR